MALPAARGQISLGQIQGEFGGANPIYLSEYYRTPNGATTGNNTNVPIGPAPARIALSNFWSAFYAVAITMKYSRSAANTNTFYLNSTGWPEIRITTPIDGGSSSFTSWIAPNVTYTITANVGNSRIRQARTVTRGGVVTYLNGMQLEDANDGDWNDLQWYPSDGKVSNVGGVFYYVVTR
jgi:hypothetical protein